MAAEEKILIILQGAGLAGAESYALNLVEELVAEGRFSCVVASFHRGPLGERLQQLGVEVVYLQADSNAASIGRLRRLLTETGISLVHFIDLKSVTIGALALLGFGRKVRTLATIHGLPEFYPNPIRQAKYLVNLGLYYILLRFVIDRVICVSADLARRMSPVIGTRKLVVIHNGIRVNWPPDAPDAHGRSVVIGTVGRLEKVKGHRYLLSAMTRVLQDFPDVRLQIIGSGPLENRLKLQARQLGIDKQVEFFGFRSDARELIRGMDIFVLPSLHEGVPYVLLEAMSLGKPVVCSDVGGVREVVESMVDGVLLEPKDPEQLAFQIKRLINDELFRTKIGSSACRKIESFFSSRTMFNKTSQIYFGQ